MLPSAGAASASAAPAPGEAGDPAAWRPHWSRSSAAPACVSIAIGEFTALLLPSLAGYEKPVAISALAALAALQLAGLRVSSRFQEITTAVKCGAFLAFVVAAIFFAPGIRSGSELASPVPSFS